MPKSKKVSLIILALTALVFSRAMFVFFDDPEGPNLLIVTVFAAIVYFLSLALSFFGPLKKLHNTKRFLSRVLIQVLIVSVFYYGLR